MNLKSFWELYLDESGIEKKFFENFRILPFYHFINLYLSILDSFLGYKSIFYHDSYNFICRWKFEIFKNFLPGFGTFLLTCIHLYVGTACWAFAGQSPQPERSCGDRSLLKWCGQRPYWLPYDMPSRQGLKEPV